MTSYLSAFYPAMSSKRRVGRGDPMRWLSDLERTAYVSCNRMLYVPSCQLVTLDDKLMGTKSKWNPVKTLFACKADKESDADVLSNALFRRIINEQLHRRGESQIDSGTSLMRSLTDKQ